MKQNIVFVMSLSGTLVTLLYLFLYAFAKVFFSPQWRYRALKIALFFFVIPLPYYEPMLRYLVKSIFPFFQKEILWDGTRTIGPFDVILKDSKTIFISEKLKSVWTIAFLFGIISGIVMCVQLFQYIKTKRLTIRQGVHPPPAILLDKMDDLKKRMKIRMNVKLILSERITGPIVIGVFRPVIVLPLIQGRQIERKEWDYVLEHELFHIKHRDLIIRFVGIFVMAVHWFNPFSYLLFHEITTMSEICCDNNVLQNKEIEGKKQYLSFVVDLASESNDYTHTMLSATLMNYGKNTIKRRMLEMEVSCNKRRKRVLSYLCCGLMCVMGTVTAFAYETPKIMEITNELDLHPNEDSKFIEDIYMKDFFDKIPYDHYFTDEAGRITEVPPATPSPKAGCTHVYVTGMYTEHKKQSDGGCKVSYYSTKKCKNCDYMMPGELYNTLTFMKCPH